MSPVSFPVLKKLWSDVREETSSDPFIALVLLVLPGRNALTLLTQPGPTSDLWSGQSMSVEDYKAAVSELEYGFV